MGMNHPGLGAISQDTIEQFRASYGAGKAGDPRMLGKATTTGYSQATGLTWYDLQAPAKSLFPVLTPLRNKIPRVAGNGDIATRWKAVTGINVNRLRGAVPEGKRNGVVTTTTVDKLQAYKTIGLEDFVTFEAVNAARGFEDVRARMGQNLLWATMIQEEKLLFGGNSADGVALGTPTTPTAANSGTGGSIAAATYSIIVVALTHGAYQMSSLAGGVPDQQTVTMPDGTTFTYNPGTSQKSAAASTVTTGSTSKITATVPVVPGAVAYAWYVGVGGSERLQAITTINSVELTALSGANELIASKFTADRSQNTHEFDGLLTHAFKSGSGASILTLATGVAGTGTKLTASRQDGGIDQIDQLFRNMWDTNRLSPNVLYVSAQEVANISSLVMKNNGSPIVRLNGDFAGGVNNVAAGSVVGSYLNRYGLNGGQLVQLQLHPDATPGMIVAHCDVLPYPISEVPNVCEVHYRQDYYQIEWPITKRQYESGVYADETFAHYFPGAIGIIQNIADGV
jgi:hypothetical protein